MKFLELIHSYYKECRIRIAGVICIVLISLSAKAQPEDALPFHLSLEECIVYAMNHQPYVLQPVPPLGGRYWVVCWLPLCLLFL